MSTATMNGLEFHSAASIFPMMEGRQFVDLATDIKANGLREPIVMHEGKILDGRNRFRACVEAGVPPEFRQWDGEGDPIVFVVSLNLHRRHLSESQRATVAADIATKAVGRPAKEEKLETPLFDDEATTEEIRPIGRISQPEAAALLNVGERSVRRAVHVKENGTPELYESVKKGNVKASAAAIVADLPKEKQAEVVAKGPQAIKETAREIKEEKAEAKRPVSSDRPADARWVDAYTDTLKLINSVRRYGGMSKIAAKWSDQKVGQAISRCTEAIQAFEEFKNDLEEIAQCQGSGSRI